MKAVIKCKHYKGNGYDYGLSGGVLSLCDKCERLLREQMREQDELEKMVGWKEHEQKMQVSKPTVREQVP